ncbi:MAG: efflux RND transporter periplasmic adaptor subunit [Deltaproteobacteria bacterium]|nr:efflux RND transporter periplasmic adaptor subunit [Deltaproteobacteria bacterium]
MKKNIITAIIILLVVVGIIAGIKALQIGALINMKPPIMTGTVTAAVVEPQRWESVLTSVGSLTAVQGVVVSAEVSGKVVKIAFEPGTMVQAGDLLVQQDIVAETAQLRSAEASLALARIDFERAKRLLKERTSSKSEYDNADAQLKQASAQVDNIKAAIAKKTIRAPFAGALGIRLVNLGQMLSVGDDIVSLQALNPVFVNFSLPQQHHSKIHKNLRVRIQTDALPDTVIEGTITAINPQVDAATRNIIVQATVQNSDLLLRPGMYVNITVLLLDQQDVLVIPATSVLNAPYSDSVFIVENAPDNSTDAGGLIVRQQFVRLGQRLGDYAAVEAGLTQGDMVVSTGAFKLRNGQAVTIDNSLVPPFHVAPTPKDR